MFITNTMEYHASEGLRECQQEETALLIRNGEMVTSKNVAPDQQMDCRVATKSSI